MSKRPKQQNGKSPYLRRQRTWRARGPALAVTAFLLLIAVAAWIVTYTRALETTRIQSAQSIDPGAHAAAPVDTASRASR